jgi:2-C-methyl-D-erythritol 4-phosphate cytidylyltransferase
MTISVIVPAAGCGARAALNGNKILAPLRDGLPVLFWTLKALEGADYSGHQLCEIIVVARPEEFPAIEEVQQEANFSLPFKIVEGGATRQDSVWSGVTSAMGDFVLVHDAARPCVSSWVVARTVQDAQKTGAAIAALPVSDTVKRSNGAGAIAQTLDRSEIWLAQTPQVFRRDLFLQALQSARQEEFQGTDCASIMERMGHEIALSLGETNNLKVTYAADLERAAAILSSQL